MVWPISEHIATLLGDGRVLVTSWSGRAQLYDSATGTWSGAGVVAHTRTAYRATLLADGRVLVTGGRGSNDGGSSSDGPLSSVELFDPATGSWIDGKPMHEPRTGHTATLLSDGRVLVAGGQGTETSATNQMGFLSSAEIYDPGSGTWTATEAMTMPHFGHAALLLDDGQVLVTGSLATPVSERFDPIAGTWRPTTDTGSAMGPGAALVTDGRVLVTDGMTGLDVYDLQLPAAHRSATTGHGFGASATLLPDDRVLIAGGVIMHYPGPGDVLAAAHLYDPR
jgi:hypothetical protein